MVGLPEFARDGSLQPSHKAIGPDGPRLAPGVADAPLGANTFEGSPVFIALIGHAVPVSFREDAPERPVPHPPARGSPSGAGSD